MSHTLGPWHVDPAYPLSVMASDARKNEPLWLVCNCIGNLDDSPSEEEANARLIAAAPELLAAVENLLDVMDLETDAQKEFSKQTQEIIDAAYAAIAKATGEQA